MDVFFVVSGYLITRILLSEAGAERAATLWHFYARRTARILPALVVVLAATACLGWWLLTKDELHSLAKHVLAGATFSSNFLLWSEAGYFDDAAAAKPLLHLWSLSIEEQFYLVWPILLLRFRHKTRFPAAIAIVGVISFVSNVLAVQHHAAASFYLLPTRFWEILIGAGLALAPALFEFVQRVRAWVPHAISIVGAGLVGSAVCLADQTRPYPGWWAVLPTLGTACIVVAGSRACVNRLLSFAPLVFVGLLSYSLYLWHWPLLSIAHLIDGGAPLHFVRLAILALSFVLAAITWWVVERPTRRYLLTQLPRRRAAPRIALAGTGATLIVGVVAFIACDLRPAVGTDATVVMLNDEVSDAVFKSALAKFERCDIGERPERMLQYCYIGDSRFPQTVALFGDSHAQALFPGLASAIAKRDLGSVQLVGYNGCAPLINVRSYEAGFADQCLWANRLALDYLVATPAIKTVVLVARANLYISGRGFGDVDTHDWRLELIDKSKSPGDRSQLFLAGMEEVLVELERADKTVVLMLEWPELGFDPQQCIDRPLRKLIRTVRNPCAISLESVRRRQQSYRKIVDALLRRHPHVKVYDPMQTICDGVLCHAMVRGHLIYRDDDHLSLFGSELLAERLVDSTL